MKKSARRRVQEALEERVLTVRPKMVKAPDDTAPLVMADGDCPYCLERLDRGTHNRCARRPKMCHYCLEPLKQGDHSHCLERLKTNVIDVPGTTRQKMALEAKASIRMTERLGRRKSKKPVKVCPVCFVEYQGKGRCCSLVHSSALRRWEEAGKAKQKKDGTWEIKESARKRLRSGQGGVRK